MKKQASKKNNRKYFAFDVLEKAISELKLNPKIDGRSLRYDKVNHFEDLLSLYNKYSKAEKLSVENLTLKQYAWAEEFVLQHCTEADPATLLTDWEHIYRSTDLLYLKLESFFKGERKDFVRFCINSLENYLLFCYNNPNRSADENNPWYYILNVLFEKGCLCFPTEKAGALWLAVANHQSNEFKSYRLRHSA